MSGVHSPLMAGARRDYYTLLGVRPDATAPEIRAAFLALARAWHPDKATDEDRPAAEARFRELTEAYETLSDPARRRDYDTRRRLEQVWKPPPAPSGLWSQTRERVVQRWGLERVPWHGWLVLGPVMLGVAAVIAAQFFFYYVFVYGTLIAVPLIAAWYAWLLWKPLALIVLAPTFWLWGFLLQGLYRNWRREEADRTAPRYRESL